MVDAIHGSPEIKKIGSAQFAHRTLMIYSTTLDTLIQFIRIIDWKFETPRHERHDC